MSDWSKACIFTVIVALISTASANPMRPDSFNPPVAPSNNSGTTTQRRADPPVPKLQAVIIIGDYRKAIFTGNREARLGERVGAYVLTTVEPSYVILSRGTLTKRLNLKTAGSTLVTPAKED